VTLLLNANAVRIPLADESVSCVVTSPPYWNLRDYGTAKWKGGSSECDHKEPGGHGKTAIFGNTLKDVSRKQYRGVCGKCGAIRIDNQLGLEPTLDQFISNMVAVFREVWRVLHPRGTLWLNLGDSYASSTFSGRPGGKGAGITGDKAHHDIPRPPITGNFKPKDLCGIPWRVAFALQADGWYLRSDIIWHKPNPMPESVTDRPTKAHEYLFLLTKQKRYFYDADAVREGYNPGSVGRYRYSLDGTAPTSRQPGMDLSRRKREASVRDPNPAGRNRRSVWTIPTAPYKGAHFATFPEKLVEPCIKAGSSEHGICPAPGCGAPWRRLTEKTRENKSYWAQQGKTVEDVRDKGKYGGKNTDGSDFYDRKRKNYDIRLGPTVSVTTTGWRATCKCKWFRLKKDVPQPVIDKVGQLKYTNNYG
jgi:DNA modification methylase